MRALFAITLVAAPGWANCPTPADLGPGITLVQNHPSYIRSDFDITAQGLTEVRIDGPDLARRSRVITFAHGLAPATYAEGAASVRVLYDQDPGQLNNLDRAGSVVLTGKVVDGTQISPFQYAFNYEGAGEAVILDCTYRTWIVAEIFVVGGSVVGRREVTFQPDLGIVIAASGVDESGGQAADYAYTWIGTAADVAR